MANVEELSVAVTPEMASMLRQAVEADGGVESGAASDGEEAFARMRTRLEGRLGSGAPS